MPAHVHVLSCGCRQTIASLVMFLAVLTGCSSKPQPSASAPAQQAASTAAAPVTLDTTDADAAQQKTALVLPKNFGHFTGDWDAIVKRGTLRVLVVYSKSGFFYDKGRPHGVTVEMMDEFEKVINNKLKPGAKKFKVVFISLPPGQLLQALNDGIGDLICAGALITPEREKLVDFTTPLASGVKLVVVTSRNAPPINSLDDLSGKDIYVSPVSVAKLELENQNQRLKQARDRDQAGRSEPDRRGPARHGQCRTHTRNGRIPLPCGAVVQGLFQYGCISRCHQGGRRHWMGHA